MVASQRGAFAVAASGLRRAAELSGDPASAARSAPRGGRRLLVGRRRQARPCRPSMTRSALASDPRFRAQVLRRRIRYTAASGMDLERSYALAEAAADELAATDPAVAGGLLARAAAAAYAASRWDLARRLAERALALAPDGAQADQAVMAKAMAEIQLGDDAAALPVLQHLAGLIEAEASRSGPGRGRRVHRLRVALGGRLPEGLAPAGIDDRPRRQGPPGALASWLATRADLSFRLGDWPAAAAQATEAAGPRRRRRAGRDRLPRPGHPDQVRGGDRGRRARPPARQRSPGPRRAVRPTGHDRIGIRPPSASWNSRGTCDEAVRVLEPLVASRSDPHRNTRQPAILLWQRGSGRSAHPLRATGGRRRSLPRPS